MLTKSSLLSPSSRWALVMLGVIVLCAAEACAGTEPSMPLATRASRFLGKFHVVMVHFPIALLMGAAAAESLSFITRTERLRAGSKFFVSIGALSSMIAATLGWLSADSAGSALAETLTLHRWLGTATALWSLVVVFLMVRATERGTRGAHAAYCAALIGGAALVGATGHFGGMLVHGLDHFAW